MGQKTRLAAKTSNRAVVTEGLVGGKSSHQGFLGTKNLEIEFVQTTDEAHEHVVHSPIAPPETNKIELPENQGVNDRGGVHGAVVRR